ncbi:MAG: TraB/GumN family protein [Methanobacteriaceae archaeon]|jgi:pheromone shutdown-related protein TraB|nr:MAG: conjugal transfer protein TraB [Methanobacterium sp. BRmetb2]MCC7557607.1 TraB/GumN family protein [Methanobacteriaceae archaeon]
MNPESLEIIGTAHVSKKSVEQVRQAILEKKPDVVAVELCANRYNNLMNEKYGNKEEEKKSIPLREMMKGDKLTLLLVSGFLSYIQRKIGDEVGVKPGSEMLVAIEAAEEVGARVALIDRDITITLRRALNQMSFFEKLKFVYGIIASFFSKDDELENIDSITEGDTLNEVMEYFQEISPGAYDVLVTERDAYMAKMLLGIQEEEVIAVVGAGHKQGITKHLKNPDEIPPLYSLLSLKKSKIPLGKLIVYSIPVIFIGIFIIALINGINIQGNLIQFIVLTGGLSFLGSIITGSKIYSALTAFAVAPVTSIHPLLAAGWFAGIVEAKLRKVNSEDFNDISKCNSFRDLMKNNLFRVLLVVVGANIGCTIGTLISIPNVIFPLFSKIIGG